MKFLFGIFLFLSLCIHAQVRDSADVLVENFMKEQGLIGLSLGIIINGKPVKASGYGKANVEYNIPVSENSVFKLGSVSKHMVATGIMKLRDEGKLSLTDTLKRYFSDAPDSWAGISIRQLLTHTSGLPTESPAFRFNVAQTDSFLIRDAYEARHSFAPGKGWEYCNLGYFVLADIIRQVSGKSFAMYMEELFSSNGLPNTRTTSVYAIIPNRADGYVRGTTGKFANAEPGIALRPSGAFVSNITDMLLWEQMMQQGKIIQGQSWSSMWKDTVLSTRKNPVGAPVYYGYGWQVTSFQGKELVFHGGTTEGFRTMYYRLPESKTAIILMSNVYHADLSIIAWKLTELITRNPSMK